MFSVISSQLNDTQVQGSPTHVKKDTYTHDSKAKSTDTKGKRSTTSNNGMKENSESGTKVSGSFQLIPYEIRKPIFSDAIDHSKF